MNGIYGSDDHARAALDAEDYEYFTGSTERNAVLEQAAEAIIREARESAQAQRIHDIAEGIDPIGTSTANEVAWWYQMGNWAAGVVRGLKDTARND
jgi:hypothetical protein